MKNKKIVFYSLSWQLHCLFGNGNSFEKKNKRGTKMKGNKSYLLSMIILSRFEGMSCPQVPGEPCPQVLRVLWRRGF